MSGGRDVFYDPVGFLCSGFCCLMVIVLPTFLFVRDLSNDDLVDWRAIRRLMRQRRFGLQAMFGLTAVLAVTLGIMRAAGIDAANPFAVIPGLCISVYALAIVCMVGLLLHELFDKGATRRMHPDSIDLPTQADPEPVDEDDTDDRADGARFAIREGGRTGGSGVVTKVVA